MCLTDCFPVCRLRIAACAGKECADIIADQDVHRHQHQRNAGGEQNAEAQRYFDQDQTKGLIVIPPDFDDQLTAGKPVEVQILVDGTDPTTAYHVIDHTVSLSESGGDGDDNPINDFGLPGHKPGQLCFAGYSVSIGPKVTKLSVIDLY